MYTTLSDSAISCREKVFVATNPTEKSSSFENVLCVLRLASSFWNYIGSLITWSIFLVAFRVHLSKHIYSFSLSVVLIPDFTEIFKQLYWRHLHETRRYTILSDSALKRSFFCGYESNKNVVQPWKCCVLLRLWSSVWNDLRPEKDVQTYDIFALTHEDWHSIMSRKIAKFIRGFQNNIFKFSTLKLQGNSWIFSVQNDGARQVGAKKQSANQHQDVHGRTDGRTDVRKDGHRWVPCVSMKNQLDGLPFFLRYGAPLARAFGPRGSSAKKSDAQYYA